MILKNAIRALPDLRKEHKTKLCNKKDAPAELHGTWREVSTSSNNTDKARLREFALDSARIPTTVVRSNGQVQTNEEAQVYAHDLDLFVTVQMLDDTLAVLSLGKLCEEHGYSYEWASGQSPHLAPVRLLHCYSRTHQEHLQVQQMCGVTIQHQETGAIAQKVKAKLKVGQK